MVCHVENRPWKEFVDRASSALGLGVEIVIITPKGIRLEHSFRLKFKASNNEVEYEALLAGLRAVLGMGAQALRYTQILGWLLTKSRATLKFGILG